MNLKGEVLLSRLVRGDIKRSVADIFRIHVISNPDVRSPVMTLGTTSFFHVKHDNVYLCAVSRQNANAALVFEFCYKVISIGRSYFGKFDEEAVKNNFVLIYELLDGEGVPDWSYSWGRPLKFDSYHRNPRLWHSAELRSRHSQNVHHL